MSDINLWHWFLLACIAFAIDILYIFWFSAANKYYAWRAGLFGVLLYALAAFGTWTWIPAIIGFFEGLYYWSLSNNDFNTLYGKRA